MQTYMRVKHLYVYKRSFLKNDVIYEIMRIYIYFDVFK